MFVSGRGIFALAYMFPRQTIKFLYFGSAIVNCRLFVARLASFLFLFAATLLLFEASQTLAAMNDDPQNAAQEETDEPAIVDSSAVVLYDSEVHFKSKAIAGEIAASSIANGLEIQEVPHETPTEVLDLLNSSEGRVVTKEEIAAAVALSELDNLEANGAVEPDASQAPDPEATQEHEPDASSCDVLIDMRHAHDFSDYPLSVDDRFYHRIYSFHRAFEYLKSQGVRVEKYESNEPIDKETLAQCKTLFMNLPSADKEPFLISEIYAIRDFIKNGGSLVLITDHTNCYFHQSRLTPLLYELDIKPQKYGICDRQQALGSEGSGWINIDAFDEHPVTTGLRQIAFQSGGGVDPRFAVAWSGTESWQDAPIMPIYGEAALGYYGNFKRDLDEPAGPSGAVLAKNFEQGKIVVVGDQNIFSPFFLQYLDAYRLWSNIFAWTLDRPELAEVSRYVENAKKGRVLACWEELMPGADRFGDPDAHGYYNFYAYLCRYYSPFCVANDDPELEPAIFAILHGGETYSSEGFEYAYRLLKSGAALVVIDPEENVFDNEKAELTLLLQKLFAEGIANDLVRTEGGGKKYVERINLSNGGKITLLRGRDSFDNSAVPIPEAQPLMAQMENIKVALREFDRLFDELEDTLEIRDDSDDETEFNFDEEDDETTDELELDVIFRS
jgi:hypothetical protein